MFLLLVFRKLLNQIKCFTEMESEVCDADVRNGLSAQLVTNIVTVLCFSNLVSSSKVSSIILFFCHVYFKHYNGLSVP